MSFINGTILKFQFFRIENIKNLERLEKIHKLTFHNAKTELTGKILWQLEKNHHWILKFSKMPVFIKMKKKIWRAHKSYEKISREFCGKIESKKATKKENSYE